MTASERTFAITFLLIFVSIFLLAILLFLILPVALAFLVVFVSLVAVLLKVDTGGGSSSSSSEQMVRSDADVTVMQVVASIHWFVWQVPVAFSHVLEQHRNKSAWRVQRGKAHTGG
jgi:Mn2+/Fe2+ NRAMP family transporter